MSAIAIKMYQVELNIAFFQQDICWEDPEANYRRVREAMQKAVDLHREPVDVMVVPETFSTGFSDSMAAQAEPEQGPTLDFAREMARRHDALFVGTWAVRTTGGKVCNRLHWVMPDGTYGYYDKGHTFRMSSEASQVDRGEVRALFEWRGWRFKPAVCYDLRFPKWLRNEVSFHGKGHKEVLPLRVEHDTDLSSIDLSYDVLLVCANWPGSRFRAWSTLLQARAIENLAYTIGCNRVGTDGLQIPYSGHSAVYDFKGLELASCQPNVEEVGWATLNREALLQFRHHWPFFLDFD